MIEITIPVFNEEKTLEDNVLLAVNFLKYEITSDFSIVIADNGSTDKTEAIGRKLSQEHKEVEFIKLNRKGVGLALRTSWLKSKAETVGYMDLDLATDLNHLKVVYDLFQHERFDIINGSRLMVDSVVKNRSYLREITSRSFNTLVRFILNVELSDGMCGFKFFRRQVAVDLINTGINTDNWFFSTEILVKALWLGLNVKEIPIHWSDDVRSKVNIPKLTVQYMKGIIRLRKEKQQFINANS